MDEKYLIEIWQYHIIVQTYKCDNIDEILKWYRENWQERFDYGMCTFYLYKDGVELNFEELNKLGFYNWS